MFGKIKKWLKQNIGFFVLSRLPWSLCDFGFSGRMVIEPTNSCNLRCPLCPMPQMKRQRGFLSFDNFKKIVDDIPKIKSINFGWAGETLLNKDVFKMAKYASAKGITTRISTNTVFLGNYIDEALNSNLNHLIVCLEGANKETHEKYRIGSNFESIKQNIKDFCEEKKKRGLKKPWVTLQSLVTKDNEKEMSAIIELARDLGVNSLEFKTISLGSSIALAEKIKRAKEFLPSDKFSRYDFKGDNLTIKSKPKLCSWLRQTVILWNGDIVPCCYDIEGTMVIGNVLRDDGFKRVWRSEKYKKYRQAMVKRNLSLCKNCSQTGEYTQSIYFYGNNDN